MYILKLTLSSTALCLERSGVVDTEWVGVEEVDDTEVTEVTEVALLPGIDF